MTSPRQPAEAETVTPRKSRSLKREAQVGLASLKEGASVAEFAESLGVPSSEIVKILLLRGMPVGAGQPMPTELMEEIAESYGFIVDVEEVAPAPAVAERPEHEDKVDELKPRPPVVTVMGHVDHGKTTLLDRIRKTSVVDGELGGITQHIGAYQVEVNGHLVTFIDTPGHEAFTALRARGANITDIVILVVAANDGVMPQTVEAISHARAAGVKIVVAVNKIDVPGADPTRVRTELTEHNIITEELGGDVPSVEVSALNGDGVDDLLEVVDLIAQLEEYKANPDAPASGRRGGSPLRDGQGSGRHRDHSKGHPQQGRLLRGRRRGRPGARPHGRERQPTEVRRPLRPDSDHGLGRCPGSR